MACKKNEGHFIATSRWSYFATHPHEFTPGKSYFCKIRLKHYCQFRNVSPDQSRNFIRRKWLGITRFKREIWIHEICPDQIRDYLEIPPSAFPDFSEAFCSKS